jgi:hypothetical protein
MAQAAWMTDVLDATKITSILDAIPIAGDSALVINVATNAFHLWPTDDTFNIFLSSTFQVPNGGGSYVWG